MSGKASIVPRERIEQAIVLIRGEKVMLDRDLAVLYGVETRVLVQAVKRNRERFPADFMFRLTKAEFDDLRSQSVMSSRSRTSASGHEHIDPAAHHPGRHALSVLHATYQHKQLSRHCNPPVIHRGLRQRR